MVPAGMWAPFAACYSVMCGVCGYLEYFWADAARPSVGYYYEPRRSTPVPSHVRYVGSGDVVDGRVRWTAFLWRSRQALIAALALQESAISVCRVAESCISARSRNERHCMSHPRLFCDAVKRPFSRSSLR